MSHRSSPAPAPAPNGLADDDLIASAARLADEARDLRDAAAALIARTFADEQSLRQKALALDSDIRRLQASAGPHSDKVEEVLDKARCLVTEGAVAGLLPSKVHGVFLKMFLGPVNLRATHEKVQLEVKQEYNKYRDETAFRFILFPSILLLLRHFIWDGCFPALPVQLYQAWLLYLYTSLAMRENILRVNGSDIRPWWIYHHYCAMLTALVSLTWDIKGEPGCCSSKQKGVLLFLIWAIMQGVAMCLQNKYQRKRLYTRIALGKARRMDVVWGEAAGVEGQVWLLYPVLFILQGFEAVVGLLLLRTALLDVVSEWQVVACGILLVIMAIGNFANTVETLMTKSRFKAKMKKCKSRQELD